MPDATRVARQPYQPATRQSTWPNARCGPVPPIAAVSPLLALQRQQGNQAVLHHLREGIRQAKLTVNRPGDPFEREADRVADQVMRMPDSAGRVGVRRSERAGRPHLQRCACGGTAGGGEPCAACQEEQAQVRRGPSEATPCLAPPIVDDVLQSPGEPLDLATRAFVEPRFGHDLSQVRLHRDGPAAASASAVDALAYTVGSHIVFGPDQYRPTTFAGRRLLAHELAHVIQQSSVPPSGDPVQVAPLEGSSEADARQAAEAVTLGTSRTLRANGPLMVRRTPLPRELRHRIELCVDPFYHHGPHGEYAWSLDPKPKCDDMTIPADRERAWKCLDRMYWSTDGTKWTWPFESQPVCTDLKLPVSLIDFRKVEPHVETPEEKARREERERRQARAERNRKRITAIRDAAPNDAEAVARLFTDAKVEDDGTIAGRVHAILDSTEHEFIPGLHTGVDFGQSGFRPEFHDPWPSSENQVGHFLSAVRLAFDPDFLDDPILLTILGAWFDSDVPLRLIIGHEKEPDPWLLDIFQQFRAQYKATTEEDIANFRSGNLDKIKVGKGVGNSMADLKLSHKGWIFGRWIAEGHFKSRAEVADWIRRTLVAEKSVK